MQKEAERNRTRRLRRLVAALSASVIVAVTLAGYAFQQREAAAGADRDDSDVARGGHPGEPDPRPAVPGWPRSSAWLPTGSRRPRRPAPPAGIVRQPRPRRGCTDSTDLVQAVSLSPDHRVLAVAAADGTLRLWDVAHPGRPAPLGPLLAAADRNPLYTVAFSPDGRLLAAAGAGQDGAAVGRERPGPSRLC